jgi:hypothetical protein
MLDSGFFHNEICGAVHKTWKTYQVAKNRDEYANILHYTDIIRIPIRLEIEVSSFHDIVKSALAFYFLCAAQISRDNKVRLVVMTISICQNRMQLTTTK